MKILADHCVFGKTIAQLKLNGFEVFRLGDLAETDLEDDEVIKIAKDRNLILISNDLDFSNIINYPPQHFKGIIVLRITVSNMEVIHDKLIEFLKSKNQSEIASTLIIIDHKHIRIRK